MDSRRSTADEKLNSNGVQTSVDDLLTAQESDHAVEITRGYPYFIQELGYQVWTVAVDDQVTKDDVEIAHEAYDAKLDSSFFGARLRKYPI